MIELQVLNFNKNFFLLLIIIYLCTAYASFNQNILNDELNGIDFVRILTINSKTEK
jgi:hypothetical protein